MAWSVDSCYPMSYVSVVDTLDIVVPERLRLFEL